MCGTPTYLYFHGVDYSRQQADVARMYEDPLGNLDLFQQYGVDYIYISSYERASYDLDQQTLTSLFPLWYQDGLSPFWKWPVSPRANFRTKSKTKISPLDGTASGAGVWSKASAGANP